MFILSIIICVGVNTNSRTERNGVWKMIFAGIAGGEGNIETTVHINSIFSSSGKKISIVDSRNITAWDSKMFKNFI